MNEHVVTIRQSRLNDRGFVSYTSQLNVEEALRDEAWTTTL